MSDPPKKPPEQRPDATLVDPLEEDVAPTAVNPLKALTPVGKRPTRPAAPEQPERKRTSGQRDAVLSEAPIADQTRLTPMPVRPAGPTGTVDTSGASDPSATIVGDEPAVFIDSSPLKAGMTTSVHFEAPSIADE